MAPIPRIIREATRFGARYAVDWTTSIRDFNMARADAPYSSTKSTEFSHQLQDKWHLLFLITLSILCAILVVGFFALFCFRDRHEHPHQTASAEDKTKAEIVEYPDMVEEHHSDGWMSFILACHAVITLGAF